MPDFTHIWIKEEHDYVAENDEIPDDVFEVSGHTPISRGRSSRLGVIRNRHTVVFGANIARAPHIDSITPYSGGPGSPTTIVTVVGDFEFDDTFFWESVTVLVSEYVDEHTMRITIPSSLLNGPLSGAISAISYGGLWSNSLAFSITAGVIVYQSH